MPLLAFSKAPYKIEPSSFSKPNSSASYFSLSSKAPFKIINALLFLLDFLWIFLATNSLPEPDGPLIITLLSVKEIFSIWSLIDKIFLLFPIKS